MIVKLTSGRVGATPQGITWAQSAGDVVELPDVEAKALIKAGQATASKEKPDAE